MTPEFEKLSDVIDRHLATSVELRQRMQNRIVNASEWDDEHLLQLVKLTERLTRMEFDLTELRSSTR